MAKLEGDEMRPRGCKTFKYCWMLLENGEVKGGVRGVLEPQNRREIRQNPQTTSDFVPNTETARTWRPTIWNWRQQDLWFFSDNIVR